MPWKPSRKPHHHFPGKIGSRESRPPKGGNSLSLGQHFRIKSKRRVAFPPPAFAMIIYSSLELLVQAHVPVTITDRVERRVVVVVERCNDRWRLAIKRVVH